MSRDNTAVKLIDWRTHFFHLCKCEKASLHVSMSTIGAYRKLKNTYHFCIYAHFLCKIDTNIWNLHKFARRGGLVEQITNLKTHLHINFYGPYSHSAATKHNVGFDVDVFSSPLQSVGRRTIFYSVNAHNSAYWWLHAQRQLPWVIDHQRRSASLETRWKLPKRDVMVYRGGRFINLRRGKKQNWGMDRRG